MITNVKLSKNDSEALADSNSYKSLIGKFLYLTITRPDIAFAIHVLTQFM